ncbi:hypothetical protein LTR16_000563 [Cryomyces antarcticus]|uniref:Uncharacterized protein n=1 Tax=Cryomyces antarcticus TaxID=329879 RepID=A0ABR0LR02_9PEZI|nr:hypothetical protein LTR16_000563 [Cryomyces antarcticus]
MTSSLATPTYVDPLPLYRRDPETASIRSSAPSYVSEAPTYHSTAPSRNHSLSLSNSNNNISSSGSSHATLLPRSNSVPSGLPSPRYAPGWEPRAHGALSDVEAHNYNVSHWSSVHSSHASRQYQNVASRRALQAAADPAAILNSIAENVRTAPVRSSASTTTASASAAVTSTPSSSPSDTRSRNNSASSTASTSSSSTVPIEPATPPFSPLEDPYLVGQAAADAARSQRTYREFCARGAEEEKKESTQWDFMLSQMADWDERERSWRKFRTEVGRTKILGRRIGIGGRGSV